MQVRVDHSTSRPALSRDGQVRHPIVLACDANYAMQLATTLRSAAEAGGNGAPLDALVLTDRFPDDLRARVSASLPAGSADISWIGVDLKPFQDFATLPHISRMTYARLLIPHVVPAKVSMLLYLDADLIVLDDLDQIWATDLEGAPVAAVLDRLDPVIKRGDPELRHTPRVRDYFNSGVLLIDLGRWREERISERALDYLRRHPDSPFKDQDALNVACDGLWKRLDPRWNFQDHFHNKVADMDQTERPAIVHFVTGNKPWKASSVSVNTSLYNSFRDRTRFARSRRKRMADITEELWARSKRRLRRYAVVNRGVELMTRTAPK